MSTTRKIETWTVAALAACGLVLFVAGCPGTGVSPVPDIGGASEYVGADICVNCHREIHTAWSSSKHAKAIDPLKDAGRQFDSDCVGCHTTGYREGGFVSMTATPKFAGVQCESCHGPGGTHVSTRKAADINGRPLTAVCGKCHTGPAQPQLEEWSKSKHAQSLVSVENSAGATDACLTCHSLDYAFAVGENEKRAAIGLPPKPLPSLDRTGATGPIAHESVGCSSCHAPHASPQVAMLRANTIDTCIGCHADPAPTIGKTPHAPNWNILTGTGGQYVSNAPGVYVQPLVGNPSIHSTVESQGGCGKCHGIRSTVDNPTPQNPNHTGHGFEIAFNNCSPCHTPDSAQQALDSGKFLTSNRIADLRQQIAAARLKPNLLAPDILRIDAAELDVNLVEEDRSGGAHNMPYAQQLLDAAQNLLNTLPP